ncbi:MAG: glutathione S-transferase family protein [Leptospiraceae bacterium]|nr:glutathione S-transferase family protein [Leptospiraceae bacterium]
MRRLIIGNKNYSSWSLRAWLLLAHFKIDFEESVIFLRQPRSEAALRKYSPTARVPVMQTDTLVIWDSLAIAESLAEEFPQKDLWPQDRRTRAHARSISAEMHSGFLNIRSQMPMNARQVCRHTPELNPETKSEIDRVRSIWDQCLRTYSGPFLFGDFCIADAMYAPVVMRFQTYRIALTEPLEEYTRAILALPAMQSWMADARQEQADIPAIDAMIVR